MTARTLKASTSPFAHLGRSAKAVDDDEETKKDDAKSAKNAEDGTDDDKKSDDAKKAKKAKATDDDEKKPAAEEGDDDEGMKGKAKSKGKAKADDEDEDDEDDEKKPEARAARSRERARIKAILVSEPGRANPVAAAHLATGTSMPRGQAIEMLAAMQAGQPALAAEPKRDDLRSRMSEVPNPSVGSEGARPAPNLAEQIVAADKKRRGEA